MAQVGQEMREAVWAWDNEVEVQPEGVDARERVLALEHVDDLLGELVRDDYRADGDAAYFGQFGVDEPNADLWQDIPGRMARAAELGEEAIAHIEALAHIRDEIQDGTVEPDALAWHRDEHLDQLKEARRAIQLEDEA